MAWCLVPEAVDRFKKGLVDKEIDPVKLSAMESIARRDFLAKFVGKENAQEVNALFESKLLLKSQKAGMISWAKSVAGMRPEIKSDILAKIDKLDKALSASEYDSFLNDLIAKRLGVSMTEEEANNIFELSRSVQEAKKNIDTQAGRIKYGEEAVKLKKYVRTLKENAQKETIGEQVKNPVKLASNLAGQFKSLKASIDISALLRQGWKTLITNPEVWIKNSIKTFKDIAGELGGKDMTDVINADIESRPNSIDGTYRKAKLAVGTVEEAFPGSISSKIPVVKRAYNASEVAYTGFLHRVRADLFDKYLQMAKDQKVNITTEELRSIASMINSLTGRGDFGRFEGSFVDMFNNIFFSPRNMKSQFDTIGHVITGAGGSNFVRKQAAKNLLKMITAGAVILITAKAINKDSVDLDSRSSDFGKIKVGNTRFEVLGGNSSLLTLASRLITSQSKSSVTGIISDLNSDVYDSKTKGDVLNDYFMNKLSPMASVINQLFLTGKTFDGKRPTVQSIISDLLIPIGIQSSYELSKDPNSAPVILALLADASGIGTNNYGTDTGWANKTTAEIAQFKEFVGDKFPEVGKEYEKMYSEWFNLVANTQEYKDLSEENKKLLLSRAKATVQDKIFKKYNFKYKKDKKVKKNFGGLELK